jgi:hypothetical protein
MDLKKLQELTGRVEVITEELHKAPQLIRAKGELLAYMGDFIRASGIKQICQSNAMCSNCIFHGCEGCQPLL